MNRISPEPAFKTEESPFSSERGTAIFEFSLILPVLIFLISGAVNFGMMMYEHRLMKQAAYIGTSAAALTPAGVSPAIMTQSVTNSINTFLGNSGLDPAKFDVKILPRAINITNPANEVLGTMQGVTVVVGRVVPYDSWFYKDISVAHTCGSSTAVINSGNAIAPRSASLPECSL